MPLCRPATLTATRYVPADLPFESAASALKRVMANWADVGTTPIVDGRQQDIEIIGACTSSACPAKRVASCWKRWPCRRQPGHPDQYVFHRNADDGHHLTRKVERAAPALTRSGRSAPSRVIKRTVALFENGATSPVELRLIRSHDWIASTSVPNDAAAYAMHGRDHARRTGKQMRRHSLSTLPILPRATGRSFAELCRASAPLPTCKLAPTAGMKGPLIIGGTGTLPMPSGRRSALAWLAIEATRRTGGDGLRASPG